MKRLVLVGREVEFSAPANDDYLASMSMTGPLDVQPIFEAFAKPGGSVVDVGANIGVTAVMAGVLVGEGRVLAIEPVPETFWHLERNVARSGLRNITCLRAAAAAEAGEVQLVTQPGANFAAFVGYEDVLSRYTSFDEFSAPAVRLDDAAREQGFDRIDFVKIDVEGYELEVLRGAEEILSSSRPVVFLEANHYCLNIFRRMSLIDFTEEVLSTFPVVFAIDTSFAYLDLTEKSTHPFFFHDNVVRGRYPNLLCAFDPGVNEVVRSLSERSASTTPPS